MAKYLVTSGSHFTPFTYDELVKSVAHMQAAHDAAQDAYDTMNLESSALARYITDSPEDSQAKALYQNYMNKLNTLQTNLWNNGYNAQTRRDLSAARSAYASDITRLGTAIKNRQERSKEYWDARHKNPDLIMGDDPGLSGLDKYLTDDTYGQNYYTYSGEQFAKEVGTDAKARASELLRDPQVVRDPNMQWMLTRITTSGFTSDEVANASAAVRAAIGGDAAMLQQLDKPSMILADVLMSHLNSTGAYGKVSTDEFNRLMDYGRSGLSQAIGTEESKDFTDPYFTQQMELDTHRKKLAITKAAETPQPTQEQGWRQRRDWVRLQNQATASQEASLHDQFHNGYTDSAGNVTPKQVTDHNGNVIFVTNATEAGLVMNDTAARKEAMELLDGLDVSLDIGHQEKNQQVSTNGVFRADSKFPSGDRARLGLGRDAVAVYNGQTGEFDEYATRLYNTCRKEHNAAVETFKKNNPDLNTRKEVFDANDARKLRERYKGTLDLANVSDYDLETAIRRMTAKDFYLKTPPLVGTDKQYDDIRENLARSIDGFVSGFSAAGKDGKSSAAVFYPVVDGGYEYNKNGVTAENVFNYDAKGSIIPDSIKEAYILPEDIVGDGEPMMRIVTNKVIKNKGKSDIVEGTYLVSARAFGDLYDHLSNRDVKEAFSWLMMPILHADTMLGWDDAMADAWSAEVMDRYLDAEENLPSAKDIIRNDTNWDTYYGLVSDILTDMLAREIDTRTFPTRQHLGLTSTNAAPYMYMQQPKKSK